MKKNMIRGKVTSGKYKDSSVEIDIGKTGHDTTVYFNKKKVNGVTKVVITMETDKLTTVRLDKYGI